MRRSAGQRDPTGSHHDDRGVFTVRISRVRRQSDVRALVRASGAVARGARRRLGLHAVDRQDRNEDSVRRDFRAANGRKTVRSVARFHVLVRRQRLWPAVVRELGRAVFPRAVRRQQRSDRSPGRRQRADNVGRTGVVGHRQDARRTIRRACAAEPQGLLEVHKDLREHR